MSDPSKDFDAPSAGIPPVGETVPTCMGKKRLSGNTIFLIAVSIVLIGAASVVLFVNNKLNNANFVAKAPEAVVSAQREQAAKLTEKISMLEDSIKKLG